MLKTGYTKVDNLLIERGTGLVTHRQFRLIVTVKKYQFGKDPPFVSSKTIAKLIGVSERTVIRESLKLQKMGLLIRGKGTKAEWDFTPLFERLRQM
ncbi:replication protein, partial [Desulfobacterota bacterium AH_259_B03_O07]|nr:replication protein [Desulfobacterota bacterium AH_259_B03_O07]